jgi:hypothetical protein
MLVSLTLARGQFLGGVLRKNSSSARLRHQAMLRQQLVAWNHGHHHAALRIDHNNPVVELHEFVAPHLRNLLRHAGGQILQRHSAWQRVGDRDPCRARGEETRMLNGNLEADIKKSLTAATARTCWWGGVPSFHPGGTHDCRPNR